MSQKSIEEETKELLKLAGQLEKEEDGEKTEEHRLSPLQVLDKAIKESDDNLAFAKKIDEAKIEDIKKQGQFQLSNEGRPLTFEDDALKFAKGDRTKFERKRFYNSEEISQIMSGVPKDACFVSG